MQFSSKESDGQEVVDRWPSKTIVIFGPPATGKTTITGILAGYLHWRSLDLECISKAILPSGKSLVAAVLAHLLRHDRVKHGMVIGADGTQQHVFTDLCYKVLLLPHLDDYKKLLALRKIHQPRKFEQANIYIYKSMDSQQNKFNYVVKTPCYQHTLGQVAKMIAEKATRYFHAVAYQRTQAAF